MEALYALIGFFLFVSAVYAILTGLGTTGDSGSESSLGFKMFYVKAPIKIIYGLSALAFIVVMIKVATMHNEEEQIRQLKNQVQSLQKDREDIQLKLFYYNPDARSFRFEFPYQPVSIFDGQVLVQPYEAGLWSSDSLKFTGILGLSNFPKGPFKNSSTAIADGSRFYLQTRDSVVWGVNIFQTRFHILGELYRESKL